MGRILSLGGMDLVAALEKKDQAKGTQQQ